MPAVPGGCEYTRERCPCVVCLLLLMLLLLAAAACVLSRLLRPEFWVGWVGAAMAA